MLKVTRCATTAAEPVISKRNVASREEVLTTQAREKEIKTLKVQVPAVLGRLRRPPVLSRRAPSVKRRITKKKIAFGKEKTVENRREEKVERQSQAF